MSPQEDGEFLITVGDASNDVFVLLEGQAEAIRFRGTKSEANTLKPGAIAGGISSFVQLPYLETVSRIAKGAWRCLSTHHSVCR